MISNESVVIAARLMSEFATRSGLSSPAHKQDRYLWTDAFAVCNFLELFERTGDARYRRWATHLIDQVHRVLGRYRDDDSRSGWISGLDEQSGHRHPTAGGLRIGKPLKERQPGEPLDEQLEWDRDGQYFHYLTKWIHALCQAGTIIGNSEYVRWAAELADRAFKRFACKSRSGEVLGLSWKMSIDLSRALVPAMGLHDALDGFISFREAQHATTQMAMNAELPDLSAAIHSLSALCQDRDWTTDDPLGLGGLLFDACRLCRLTQGQVDIRLVEKLIAASRRGLLALITRGDLERPASHRLAFRELGLAIGLRALPIIANALGNARSGSAPPPSDIDVLLRYADIGEEIVAFWLTDTHLNDRGWRDHRNINEVMLATGLVPATFLSVGQRVPFDRFVTPRCQSDWQFFPVRSVPPSFRKLPSTREFSHPLARAARVWTAQQHDGRSSVAFFSS